MTRVIGIDPGTVSVDLCGLDDGRVFLDASLPTEAALADPRTLLAPLERAAPLDLVAGPSGYGLPLIRAREATDDDLRLAYLGAPGDDGGIGGLRAVARALAASDLPVVFTPGVVHLSTVPAHRKVNRVDMGTADKVCAAALAVREQARRRRCALADVSLILLELGGAFSAGIAVEGGRIVDGVGGTSGPLGVRAAGALDGEVAFLAGEITKGVLFGGGAAWVSGDPAATASRIAAGTTPAARTAWAAFVESAAKTVAQLAVVVPQPAELVLSGRVAGEGALRDALAAALGRVLPGVPVVTLDGFAATAKQGAQGAALIADGLAGGGEAALVATMALRDARGTALDHLYVIPPATARRRVGVAAADDRA